MLRVSIKGTRLPLTFHVEVELQSIRIFGGIDQVLPRALVKRQEERNEEYL